MENPETWDDLTREIVGVMDAFDQEVRQGVIGLSVYARLAEWYRSKQRWIRSSQQKPPEGLMVQIWHPGYVRVAVGWLRRGEWYGKSELADKDLPDLDPTYWRPLDTAPGR